MSFFLKITAAIIAGLLFGFALGNAKAQETVPLPPTEWASGSDYSGHDSAKLGAGVECHAGLEKLGRRAWDFSSVSLVGNKYFVLLSRTEKHESKNASSIMTTSLCIVTARPFRLAERLRVRHGRLVPAF